MKKAFYLILLIFSFVFNVSAEESLNSSLSKYEYIIEKYDINIDVSKDNIYTITENITAYFNVPKHGIYRKIPLKNTVTRADGTVTKNTVTISNVSANEKYETYIENNRKIIKLGDSNTTITGRKEYIISYVYNIGDDPSNYYDEFYFNLIGTEWETEISNVTFTIKMPKEFDAKKIGITTGKNTSTNSPNGKYYVNGNTITGFLYNSLNPQEALTLRLELPEGYYEKQPKQIIEKDYFAIFLMFVLVFVVVVSYILWKKYGDDEEVITTVEFYPPADLNSLEAALIYDNASLETKVASLIIYLANKGYIEIFDNSNENNDKELFKFRKLKEYDGTNENEKLFFEALFQNKDADGKMKPCNEVSCAELDCDLSKVSKEVCENLRKGPLYKMVYEIKGTKVSWFIKFFIFFAGLIGIAYPMYKTYYQGINAIWIIFAMIFGVEGPVFLASGIKDIKEKKEKMEKNTDALVALVSGILFIRYFIAPIFVCSIFMWKIMKENQIYCILCILSFVASFIMNLLLKSMHKRTPKGNELYGKILGFKDFLEKVEKEKLEALVESNPNYFYDILPYTYVLNVSSVWIEKFENFVTVPPNWYSGKTFDYVSFNSFMDRTMRSTSNLLSSGSSSVGSTGGGISGGGSGGGGGGSW